jgi:hypothetical protein
LRIGEAEAAWSVYGRKWLRSHYLLPVTVKDASGHLKGDLASLLHQLEARVEAPTSSSLFWSIART